MATRRSARRLSLTTSVTTQGVGGADCLTVVAIVFKTGVKDVDGDGLLDLGESATAPIIDPQGQPLPLLGSMRADPEHMDLFVETATPGPIQRRHTAVCRSRRTRICRPATC